MKDQLLNLATSAKQQSLLDLFASEPDRVEWLSKQTQELIFDFSKQKISKEAFQLLIQFAQARNIGQYIEQIQHASDSEQITGDIDKLNVPELYHCLRSQYKDSPASTPIPANADKLVQYLKHNHSELERLVASVKRKAGTFSVVNIGMGGSSIGQELVNQSLSEGNQTNQLLTLSSMEKVSIQVAADKINHANFVIILQSKSFNTLEIFKIYETLCETLQRSGVQMEDIKSSTYAVTARVEKASAFGIDTKNILKIPGWVTGRYSIWSSMCLPVCLAKGMDAYYELLEGANAMDQHFFSSELPENIPVIGAIVDFWNHNMLNIQSRVILPYSSRLRALPDYLAQLETESLGKSVDTNNESIELNSGQFVWGQLGTEYQHSIGQILHQGTSSYQAELIGVLEPDNRDLLMNLLAQSHTMMHGYKSEDQHRYIAGNRPSTTILLKQLTAKSLGSLLSYYEHKVVILSKLLNINAFDQWGVERAKDVAREMKAFMEQAGPNEKDQKTSFAQDPSTSFLLNTVKTSGFE